MLSKDTLLFKLEALRTRIEEWCSMYGYDKMDNVAEHKNTEGEVVWHRSDWEYIDDIHNLIYNDEDYYYNKDTFRKFNKMWKKYNIDTPPPFKFEDSLWDNVTIISPDNA